MDWFVRMIVFLVGTGFWSAIITGLSVGVVNIACSAFGVPIVSPHEAIMVLLIMFAMFTATNIKISVDKSE